MSLHLAEIAAAVAPGAHAVPLLDQAGWHLSDRLEVPPNRALVPLPPKCPELNPVETVWQFLRETWLSNRVFRSSDDILDHCSSAWNRLVGQPWTIMSIGLRDWAHRADRRRAETPGGVNLLYKQRHGASSCCPVSVKTLWVLIIKTWYEAA